MLGFSAISQLPISTIPVAVSGGGATITTGSDAGEGRVLTKYERRRRREHWAQMRRQAMTLAEVMAEAQGVPGAQAAARVAEAITTRAETVENVLPVARLEYLRAYPGDVGIAALRHGEDEEADQLTEIIGRLRGVVRTARLAREAEVERLAVEAKAAADDEDDVAALLMMW